MPLDGPPAWFLAGVVLIAGMVIGLWVAAIVTILS